MSDTWDECRAHVAEQICERGECDHNCNCHDRTCAACGDEVVSGWLCAGCAREDELLMADPEPYRDDFRCGGGP